MTFVKKESTYEITLSKERAAMNSYAISYTNKKGNYITAVVKAENAIEAAEKYAKRKAFGKNIFKYVKVKTFDAETKGVAWAQLQAPKMDSSGEFINISVEFYK